MEKLLFYHMMIIYVMYLEPIYIYFLFSLTKFRHTYK